MYPQIMGILNYTPDSFSDGGKYFTPELAEKHAADMVSQGADIIDIGCNSTRPGCRILSAEEELERLRQVLPVIVETVNIPVSVDTFYKECAEFSLDCGAEIINDVSGIFNPDIAVLVIKHKSSYSVMHNAGGADNIGDFKDGIVSEVNNFFDDCIDMSFKAGMPQDSLILDPGFGFGKSVDDNYELLSHLKEVKREGYRLLIGISRKRFIRGNDIENSDYATSAAGAYAQLNGADIIRVHNVTAAVETRRVINGIKGKYYG